MIDRNLVVGPFQCNCRILACPETGLGVLIDPGDEPEKILNLVKSTQTPSGASIQIKYLLHTHAHLDHIGGTRGVKSGLPSSGDTTAKIAVHRADEPLYQQLKTQGQLFGFQYLDPLPIDQFLEHEEELQVGTLKFSVVHTPGHSPGSICFRLHEDSQAGSREALFSGDTLFKGSVGRTDLWGANSDQMFKSIRQRLLTLDDDTRVCPGHGDETTIGVEKRANPFLR